ncbi:MULTISPECIES: hypothetical protein [Paenibacillus]|nr:hypothetical protein [Paenibacillus caseinilyticus]MCZ8523488.1 hypothetical protein [Paenibacillus caseinilyticus]
MSKLIIAVLMAVLLGGSTLYVVGGQLVPAVGTAGATTRSNIVDAFQ